MDFSHLVCTFCQFAYILRSPRHDGRFISQTQMSNRKQKQKVWKTKWKEQVSNISNAGDFSTINPRCSPGVEGYTPVSRRTRGLTDWNSRLFTERSQRGGGRRRDVTGHVRAYGQLQHMTAYTTDSFPFKTIRKDSEGCGTFCVNVRLSLDHRGRYSTTHRLLRWTSYFNPILNWKNYFLLKSIQTLTFRIIPCIFKSQYTVTS